MLRIDRISAVCENPPHLDLLQVLHKRNIRPTESGASDWQRSALTVMKIVVALLAAAAVNFASPILAQDAAKPAAPPKDSSPHRVGLVDMAEVFQGYKKFEDMRAELQADIEKSDAEAKLMVERMQKMQQEMIESKLAPGVFNTNRAKKLCSTPKVNSKPSAAATQRKLTRRESEMFKVIYSDTTSMVKKYAEFAKFTVVIRFDRKDINDETAPSEAVQRMNKQVVFHRAEDDITDVVLQTLNKQYESTAGSRPPVKGASLTEEGRAPALK